VKTILVILDGISENKNQLLNNKSPLEYAYTPTLDKIKSKGFYFKTKFHKNKSTANSLYCISKILGLEDKDIPDHRAYLESLAYNIPVTEDDWVLRCNLISLKKDRLFSFNAIGLTREEKANLSKKIYIPNGLTHYHLGDYKNLLLVKARESLNKLAGFFPHENIDNDITKYLNKISSIKPLQEFIRKNKYKINGIDYLYLPWGPSKPFPMPSFYDIHEKKCFSVSHTEIVKGLFQNMGIKTAHLQNSTGDYDTDLKEKSNKVIYNFNNYDVTVAHINGADEVSHRKNLKSKIDFIEKIDKEFITPIYKTANKNSKIIILSDHQTSSISGKHEEGFVDLICSEKKINKNNLFK
jgi:2,3-bisphosphoglycerate-independent phosphoglycerate mutase